MSDFLLWAFSWIEVYGAPFSGVVEWFFESRKLLGVYDYSVARLVFGGGILAYLAFRIAKFALDVLPG